MAAAAPPINASLLTSSPTATAPIPTTTPPPPPPSSPAGSASQARWPSLPANIMSLLNPFAQPSDDSSTERKPHAGDPTKTDGDLHAPPPEAASLERPILAAVQLKDVSASRPSSPSRSSTSVMFAEPETRSTSDDGSRDASLKRVPKNSRPKTRYSICHPVPESKVKQKLHRQPRSLLQLHRLQPNARPLPALEVIPSANFSVRLRRAMAKVFQGKHNFCVNDLLVLKAEKYGTEDEEAEARDVIGLICKGSREEQKSGSGKMLIHMASGQQWEAYATANGAYECCVTDEHGLKETVRWVPKKNKDGRGVSSDGARKFNFSTISPHTRRHPVIANLQKTGLDINDTYKIPEPAVKSPPSTPQLSATVLEDAFDEDACDRNDGVTDEATRQIVIITAIWVAMREGWSPNFRYDDKRNSGPLDMPASPGKALISPIATPPGSPAPFAPLEQRASIRSFGSGVVRRASQMGRSNRNSIASLKHDSDVDSARASRSASVNPAPGGRSRADSAATVLVHRATSNRRRKADPLHEASGEDLRSLHSKSFQYAPETARKPQSSPLAKGPTVDGHSSSESLSEPLADESVSASRHSRRDISDSKIARPMSTTTNGTTDTRRLNGATASKSQIEPKAKTWKRFLLCAKG